MPEQGRFAPFTLAAVVTACLMDLSGTGGGGNPQPPIVDCTAQAGVRILRDADTIEVGRATLASATVSTPMNTQGGVCSFRYVLESSDTTVAKGTLSFTSGGGGYAGWVSDFELRIEGRAPGTAIVRLAVGSSRDSLELTVAPTATRYVSLGVGTEACATASDGATYCWGDVPARQVRAPAFVLLVPAGQGYGFCGLDLLGKGTCFSGARGIVAVGGGRAFRALDSRGDRHMCGVTRDSLAMCWGANDVGQLGTTAVSSSQQTVAPYEVSGGRRWLAIGVGVEHSCGMAADSTILCWGANGRGQLGGSGGASVTPAVVAGLPRTSLVAVGSYHACTLSAGGEAWCWGRNDAGQIGSGAIGGTTTAQQVSGGLVFVALSAGEAHTCGLLADGTAYCWGANGSGQLGDGSTTARAVPIPVSGGLRFQEVSAGVSSTCGIATDGRVYCWGALGPGTVPRRVSGQP